MKTIKLTTEEIGLAVKINSLKNPASPTSSILMRSRWILIIVGIILLGGKFSDNHTLNQVTYFIGLFVFLTGVCLLSTLISNHFYTKKLCQQGKILFCPFTLSWDKEYITIHADRYENKQQWQLFNEMLETDKFLLVYYYQYNFLVIPKQYFENNDEMQDFIQHLKTGIEQNKTLNVN